MLSVYYRPQDAHRQSKVVTNLILFKITDGRRFHCNERAIFQAAADSRNIMLDV